MTSLRRIVAALAVAVLSACQPSSAPIKVDAGQSPATGHRYGLAVNSVSDIGYTVSEIGAFFDWPQTAGGTSSIAEESIGVVGPGPQTIPIGAIILHPTSLLAISGSAYLTVNVYKRTAGSSQVLIGTTTPFPGGTAWAAFTPLSLTLQTGAGSFVSPNDTITMAITDTGSATIPVFVVAGFTKVL